ncbi:MAG TPA: hypothetical protein VK689_12515 [Armatimonadota bacterium]|nr:hypothetical protein [Armatimonadota bacterium]
MHLRLFTLASLLLVGVTNPGYADNTKLEQEVTELRARLEALERALAEAKKAEADQAKQTPSSGPSAGDKKGKKPLLPPSPSALQALGYIETRFTNYANSRGDERATGPDFQVSRLRARLNFAPQEHWLVSLEVNAGTRGDNSLPVDMREFYFQYLRNDRLARVGQQRVPFGFQVGAESSRDRAALERARVFTQFFPNERDIGVILGINNHINNPDYNPKKPRYTLGITNGEGINRSDRNRDKSYSGNVVVPVGQHELGASFYTGSTTADVSGNPVTDTTKRAVGVEHRYNSGRFHTQFEYLFGELFGSNSHGGLGQLLYNTGTPGNFFVRTDLFDPNRDLTGDFWRRVSLGWYKDLTPYFRLTGQYDFLRAEGTDFDNTWGIEAQLRF